MSETESEPEPIAEPGQPDETAPTPSLPSEEPGPDPEQPPGGPGGPAPDPRRTTPGL